MAASESCGPGTYILYHTRYLCLEQITYQAAQTPAFASRYGGRAHPHSLLSVARNTFRVLRLHASAPPNNVSATRSPDTQTRRL